MNKSPLGIKMLMITTALGCISISAAQVTFNYTFTDAAGVGFNDNSEGASRQAALQTAGSYISSILGNSYNATIEFSVNGSVTNDSTLASAASNFNLGYPGDGFGSKGDIMTKILGGADPSGDFDGTINWNFEDHLWATGNTVGASEFDMIAVAMHEITHALGFASDINQNGSSAWGDPAGTATAWSPFDEFVADADGSLINAAGVLDGGRWATASVGGTGGTNGLFFNGANAMAAFGGNAVPLFSPSIWENGSSGSHLDTDFFGVGTFMMNHAVSTGLAPRAYSSIELGILKDIGYTQAVPEPATMAVIGLGIAALARRKRKNA
jgi:hypothetical protein